MKNPIARPSYPAREFRFPILHNFPIQVFTNISNIWHIFCSPQSLRDTLQEVSCAFDRPHYSARSINPCQGGGAGGAGTQVREQVLKFITPYKFP